jgi:uncharacterized protein (TIGR02284 family)
MATSTASETRHVLNGLVETCKDGAEGFKLAASAVKDADLPSELQEYGMQRAEFAYELAETVDAMGSEAPESGSVAGSLHRAWMNIKSAVASSDPHSILAECERGEDSAVDAYRNALQAGLPVSIYSLVERQSEEVQRVHDRIRQLRDAAQKN